MQIKTELIKNKQRILIGGNEGASEIYEIAKKILFYINKPADFCLIGQEFTPSNAPLVIIRGDNERIYDKAFLQGLDIHILLVHRVTEDIPSDFKTFEQYVDQLEKLADDLPRAGSFIYFEEDNVATMMGKKERPDVKNVEYSRLKSVARDAGLEIKSDSHKVIVKTEDSEFPAYAGGAKALLNRIGVSDEQFFSGLKAL